MADFIDQLGDPMEVQRLQERQLELARQVKLAELLRKGAGVPGQSPEMPQGQMVSGRYVAPHWTQQLAAVVNPLFAQYNARTAEDASAKKESALAQAVAQEKARWAEQMPMGTPATPDMPAPAEGPATEGGVEPAQVGVIPGQARVLPSAVERAKFLARGDMIPGNATNVLMMGKTMGEEVTREDNQAARKEALDAQMASTRQNKLDQLEFQRQQLEAQMKDKALSREQLAAYQSMHDSTLRAIAAGNQQARIDAVIARRSDKELTPAQRAVQERFIATQAEHLSRQAAPLVPMLESARSVQEMLDANPVDEKTGKTGDLPGLGYQGKLPGFVLPAAGVENRRKVKQFANAMIRNQAGLSQTLSETDNANLEILSNGNYTQKEFEAAWPSLMEKLNVSVENLKGGYEEGAWDKYQTRSGGRTVSPVTSKRGVKAAAGSGLTPAQQARLDQLRAAKAAEGK